jgi:hypothetical protein
MLKAKDLMLKFRYNNNYKCQLEGNFMFSRLFTDTGHLKVLALYSMKQGVVHATPAGTEHMAHVRWRRTSDGNESSIDYFLVNGGLNLVPNQTRSINGMSVDERAEMNYGIGYQVFGNLRHLTEAVRIISSHDVATHVKRISRENNQGHLWTPRKQTTLCDSGGQIEYIDRLSAPKLKVRGLAQVQTMGKQDYHGNCVFDLNLDFARWCAAGITPEGFLAPWNDCEYCYSAHTHAGYPFVDEVDKNDLVEQIERAREVRAGLGKPTRYMRFGKRVEVGARMFREQLIASLEACAESGISCIMPTKFLEFDKDVAGLLRRTDSTLLVSLGNDELEKGAVLNGRTQDARIADGLRYQGSGVRVVAYPLVDATMEDGGEFFRGSYLKALETFQRVQVLPLRLRHADKAREIMGAWHGLTRERSHLLDEASGAYELARDATRIPVIMHSSITDGIGENNDWKRMCADNSCKSYCGKCFMPKEEGIVSLTVKGKSHP